MKKIISLLLAVLMLFSVVNVSRFVGVDSEEALTISNEKFIPVFLRLRDLLQNAASI